VAVVELMHSNYFQVLFGKKNQKIKKSKKNLNARKKIGWNRKMKSNILPF